jgi:hypothetical protein
MAEKKQRLPIANRNGVPAYENAPPRQTAPVTMAEWMAGHGEGECPEARVSLTWKIAAVALPIATLWLFAVVTP